MNDHSMSRTRIPHGAMTAVVAQSPNGPRYLLVHNAEDGHHPDEEGDWTWGSPAGSREPGEQIEICAARELFEETGIQAEPVPVITDDIDWAIFYVEVPWGTSVRLSEEHNNFAWVSFEEACRLCRPQPVEDSFRLAASAAKQARRG